MDTVSTPLWPVNIKIKLNKRSFSSFRLFIKNIVKDRGNCNHANFLDAIPLFSRLRILNEMLNFFPPAIFQSSLRVFCLSLGLLRAAVVIMMFHFKLAIKQQQINPE